MRLNESLLQNVSRQKGMSRKMNPKITRDQLHQEMIAGTSSKDIAKKYKMVVRVKSHWRMK